MTYYEELGIGNTASSEEIRAAYKHLARLLHPDKLRNDSQRKVAECQMRRLNAVYETLIHADKRRQYDLSLQPVAVGPSDSVPDGAQDQQYGWPWLLERLRGPNGAWIGAGVIVAFLMAWTLFDSLPHTVKPEPERSSGEPALVTQTKGAKENRRPDRSRTEPPDAQNVQLRRRVEDLIVERDSAVARMHALESKVRELSRKQEHPLIPQFTVARPPPLPPATFEPAIPVHPEPAQEPVSPLAGTWFFARQRAETSKDLYPPEFIETIITEESGMLHGRYRARYVVSDRAISPEVAFHFTGKAARDSAKLVWSGAGGAKGEVKLRLLSRNSLEVAWVAKDLGTSLGLGYGTAVLIRASDPQ